MFSKQIIGQGATIRQIIRGRESQIQHLKKKTDKNLLTQFELFTFFKHARLQKNFHGRVLSIRVFSAERHYGLKVSLCG